MNVTLHINGEAVTLEQVARKPQQVSFTIGGVQYSFRSQRLPDGSFLLERETAAGVWERTSGSAWQGKEVKRVQLGALEAKISELTAGGADHSAEAALSPRAPMPGIVRQIMVKKGERVAKGQPLAVMEAMKLQMTLSAGADAVVDDVLVKEGELISEGAELVRLSATAAKAA